MADQVMIPDARETLERVRGKMKPWGISMAFLAARLRVSRQYVWQAVNHRTHVSPGRAVEIERAVDSVIAERAHMKTFGARLRAARLSAGLTLKEVATMIGYSWVGVERWERDVCLPKPGVLWHLFSLYGVSGNPVLHEVGAGGHRRPDAVLGLPGERIRVASLQGNRGNSVGRRRKSSKHPSGNDETPLTNDELPPAE